MIIGLYVFILKVSLSFPRNADCYINKRIIYIGVPLRYHGYSFVGLLRCFVINTLNMRIAKVKLLFPWYFCYCRGIGFVMVLLSLPWFQCHCHGILVIAMVLLLLPRYCCCYHGTVAFATVLLSLS